MKPSILLVGTKQSGLAYLSMLLEKAGYRTTTCREPQAVDELLEQEPVDLIFVDDHGPELNAAELCSRLQNRSEFADVPVLVALPPERHLQENSKRTNEMLPVVRKPILPHRFLAMVEQALTSAVEAEDSD